MILTEQITLNPWKDEAKFLKRLRLKSLEILPFIPGKMAPNPWQDCSNPSERLRLKSVERLRYVPGKIALNPWKLITVLLAYWFITTHLQRLCESVCPSVFSVFLVAYGVEVPGAIMPSFAPFLFFMVTTIQSIHC